MFNTEREVINYLYLTTLLILTNSTSPQDGRRQKRREFRQGHPTILHCQYFTAKLT